MADQEASGAVVSALQRFALAYLALQAVFRVLAAIAGGALPGTTIIILAVATVMARRRFFALRQRQPGDHEKIALLFGAFLIAMIASGLITLALAVAHGMPAHTVGETIDRLWRARPIDVLIVRYLLDGLAYFLIIWISYGPLLERYAIPARKPDKDDGPS